MAQEFHWLFWDGQPPDSPQVDPPAYTRTTEESYFGSGSQPAADAVLTYLTDVLGGVRSRVTDLWSETAPIRSVLSASFSSRLGHKIPYASSSLDSLWRSTNSAVSSGIHSLYDWLGASSLGSGDSLRTTPCSSPTSPPQLYLPWTSKSTKDRSHSRISGQQIALLVGLGLVTLSVIKTKHDRASAIDVLKLSALAGGVIISHKSLQDVDWSSCARPRSDK